MITRPSIWSGALIATLSLLNTESVMAQGGGGFSFGFGNGNRQIRLGTPRGNNSSRRSGPGSLPSVISGGNSSQTPGLRQALQSAASGVASESLRQLAPGVQQTLQHGSPFDGDRHFRPQGPRSGLQLNLGGFRIEHAEALATAIVLGSHCAAENPFCDSQYECPPRPVEPSGPRADTPEEHFELARRAFRNRDYDRAGYHVDQAIEQLPEEGELFQFRSLILFAEGKHPPAAEAAYTALLAGPGWSWATLYKFYGDADLYTRHLRNLEATTKAHPDSAAHHFLLAYHCLMLNQVEAGRKRLERVLELDPDEPLTRALLDILPAAD